MLFTNGSCYIQWILFLFLYNIIFFLELIINFFCLLNFLSTYSLFNPKLSKCKFQCIQTNQVFYQFHLLEAISPGSCWPAPVWIGLFLGCCKAVVLWFLFPMIRGLSSLSILLASLFFRASCLSWFKPSNLMVHLSVVFRDRVCVS